MTFTPGQIFVQNVNGNTIEIVKVNPTSGRVTYLCTYHGETHEFCHGSAKVAKLTAGMVGFTPA